MSAEQLRQKKVHREAVILAETKRLLGFPVAPASASPVTAAAPSSSSATAALKSPEEDAAAREVYDVYGLSMSAVNAYLLRFLRSKHLSVDDAVAKLRRRRVFERTLPTISVTATTVSALRSGALHLLDRDVDGRPVLYVNVAAFALPTLELDEAQRLLVILLEFMQAQCLLQNNEDEAERQHPKRTEAAPPANGSPSHGSVFTPATASPLVTTHDIEKEAVGATQQFTLLINEEGTPWGTHEAFLRNCSTFFSMFPKYYPKLLGAVLVLGASFETRMAIKASLGNSPDDIRDAVQMIERADLPRYMDARAIPVELGGHKQVAGSAMNFSEAVLRHWFTLTSQMEAERVGSSTGERSAGVARKPGGVDGANASPAAPSSASPPLQRPLFVPPPPLGTAQRYVSRQRQTIELQHLTSSNIVGPTANGGASGSPGNKQQHQQQQQRPQRTSSSVTRGRRLPMASPAGATSPQGAQQNSREVAAAAGIVHSATLRMEDVTDDGVCSALSGVEDRDEDGGDPDLDSPSLPLGVATTQLFTAASSLANSMSVETDGLQRTGGPLGNQLVHSFSGPLSRPPAATATAVSSDEAARFADHPEEAVAALRHERQRRLRAEQALQFHDLGVTLDLRNASTIERELAGLHHDLNVLVAEILVRAEAAGRRQTAPPTLTQLLDLTLTAFESATRTPSTVPAMAFAEPVQRDQDNATCCSFM